MFSCARWAVLMCVAASWAAAADAPAEGKAKVGRLDGIIVVEAESARDVKGAQIGGARDTRSEMVFFNGNGEASGGAFISPVPGPFRMYKSLAAPVEAVAEVEVPTAGRWYAHVRYAVTPETIRRLLSGPKPPGHFRAFQKFQVLIGDKTLTCGASQAAGAEFRWDHFTVDLPAGRLPVRFRMPDLAGPDCLVLTPNPDYKPEPGDYSGPLWFRFKVLRGPSTPYYIRCRCYVNPYAGEVKDAGFLFADEVVPAESEAVKRREGFLRNGEWSPWVKTFETKAHFAYTHVSVMPGPGKVDTGSRKYGFSDTQVAFQASTRPDPAFVIHETVEDSGPVRGLYILMPEAWTVEGMRRGVKSFTEWADERMSLVTRLGVKADEGPRRVQVFTDASATVPRDVDVVIESCRLLGFNGLDVGTRWTEPEDLWKRISDAGFTWTQAHHLSPVYEIRWADAPSTPAQGKSVQARVDEFIYERSADRLRRLWDGRPETRRRMLDLANLVDEPGPMPLFLMINLSPALRACFHEFLQANGLTPGYFGKGKWDEVEAVGYMARAARADSRLTKVLTDMGVEVEWVQSGKAAPVDDEAAAAEPRETPAAPAAPAEKGKTPLRRVQVRVTSGQVAADLAEKKLHYWTQRFRSFFTRKFYGAAARAVEAQRDEGRLRASIKDTPNFQAAPIMEVRMWDGGLNLFEWAREKTTNCLMVEDWVNDPCRVSFGINLLDAAARKQGQSLAFLIVGDRHFRQRYLSGLAAGARLFVDYSYGPLVTKGPAWASNPEYVRDWADMLRWTRRCEDDLLASKKRPAQAALLVANSSETNAVYYSAAAFEAGLKGRAFGARPLFRRAGIWNALIESDVPVEIVSEEEILQDKALERYKALYVVDTHVSGAVQAAIKTWVQGGGALWADYTALARDEFDQPSDVMNEVFGLSARGALPDAAKAPEKETAGEKISVAAGEGVEAVTFTGSAFRPAWKVSTGRAAAQFEDGSPALVRNRYGKGQAVLLGCSALSLSAYSQAAESDAGFDKVRRLAALGAEAGGVARHCRVSLSRVPAVVYDGPEQSVVFLINATGAAQKGVSVRLATKQAFKSAFDGRGRTVAFEQKDGEVVFTRDLAFDDGEVVVFRR